MIHNLMRDYWVIRSHQSRVSVGDIISNQGFHGPVMGQGLGQGWGRCWAGGGGRVGAGLGLGLGRGREQGKGV